MALVGEALVSVSGVRVNQNDSAAIIAASLADRREQILVAAYLSVFYAAAFPIWHVLHRLLCGSPDRTGFLGPLVVIGGTRVYAGSTSSSFEVFGRHRDRARSLEPCDFARLSASRDDT